MATPKARRRRERHDANDGLEPFHADRTHRDAEGCAAMRPILVTINPRDRVTSLPGYFFAIVTLRMDCTVGYT